MSLLLPQLSVPVARQVFAEFVEKGQIRSQLAHEQQTFSALGGSRASEREVNDIAEAIREGLKEFDFRGRGTVAQKRDFDETASRILLEALRPVSVHQASQPGVWRFVCCVMFPDLVFWRWGKNEGSDLTEERYLQITRNTFARLWKRAYVLQMPDQSNPTYLLDELNEDELVQIMERPTVGGNRQLAVCLAKGFVSVVNGTSQLSSAFKETRQGREALMRQLTRGLIRRGSVFAIDAMTPRELEQLIESELGTAIAGLARTVGR